ncbi:MAG TPA: YajG family lipoprotein [Verrucomicrobiae bacterium]|nr:YajG family lipoprotein [Verrucomicrobiae bacterium]
MSRSLNFLTITIAVAFAGCAWVHQDATLKLDPAITPSSIGRDATVAVKVLDHRGSKTIGYRGLDSKNASITTDQDVAALFQAKILEGLSRKGFNAVPHGERPGRPLTVEIRQIEYKTDMDFWKGIIQAEAAINAWSVRDGASYERTYRGQRKDTTLEAPAAKANERLINGAISDALQNLLEDERLIRFLAN